MITEIDLRRVALTHRKCIKRMIPKKATLTRLVQKLQNEESLLASRITAETVAQMFEENRAVAYGTSDVVSAFCALWPTHDPKYLELGTLWAAEKLRGMGLAHCVFNICEALQPDKSLFLITARPAVVVMAIKNGWILEGDNWEKSLTQAWKEKLIGPLWERYPDSEIKQPGMLLYKETQSRLVLLDRPS